MKSQQNDFLEWLKASGKSANTIKNYKADLTAYCNYVKSTGGDDHGELIPAFIKECSQKGLAPNSVRRRATTLATFIAFIQEELKVKIPEISKESNSLEPLSLFATKSLMRYFEATLHKKLSALERLKIERDRLLFLMVILTGMSQGQLKGLLQTDLQFKDKEIKLILGDHTYHLPEACIPYFHSYDELLTKMKKKMKLTFFELFFHFDGAALLPSLSVKTISQILTQLSSSIDYQVSYERIRRAYIFKELHKKRDLKSLKKELGLSQIATLKKMKAKALEFYMDESFLSE